MPLYGININYVGKVIDRMAEQNEMEKLSRNSTHISYGLVGSQN
jgi:hypothetical protein